MQGWQPMYSPPRTSSSISRRTRCSRSFIRPRTLREPRGGVQKLFHELRLCEGQPGGADLGGQILGFEGLVSGHEQQIEVSFLPVAQHEIFADGGLQNFVHGGAGLHGHGGLVIDALIGDTETVQQVIDPYLLGESGAAVLRTTLYQFHSKTFFHGFLPVYHRRGKPARQKNKPPQGKTLTIPGK